MYLALKALGTVESEPNSGTRIPITPTMTGRSPSAVPRPRLGLLRARWDFGVSVLLPYLARILKEFIAFGVFVRQGLLLRGHDGLRLQAMAPFEHGAVVNFQFIRQQMTAFALREAAQQEHPRSAVVMGAAQ